MAFKVALVGRPNVGKSTLFNRLAGRRAALVDDTPGVTRDRREGTVEWGDLVFTLVDTAGYDGAVRDGLSARIQIQTERAMRDADLVLMMVDARAGITPLDHDIARHLRALSTPLLLAANKYDGGSGQAGVLDAFGLGLGEPIALSAVHGDGLVELRRALVAATELRAKDAAPADAARDGGEHPAPKPIQLAVIGRPNVGKSTLLNALLGEERLVAGPEPGITRDSVAIEWSFQGIPVRLIDTAGMRRRTRVSDRLERLSAEDSRRAIRFAHVCAVVIDAEAGLEKPDLGLLSWVAEEGRAPLIVANKWDRIADGGAARAAIASRIERSLSQIRGVPVVALSALTSAGLRRLMPTVIDTYEVWNRHVSTGALNAWLRAAARRHPPPRLDGRPLAIRYITQVSVRPPTFALFLNRRVRVPDSYLRFLTAGLRERFGLAGVPLRFLSRTSDNPYAPDGGKRSAPRGRRRPDAG
jgi:GTP-binding protein